METKYERDCKDLDPDLITRHVEKSGKVIAIGVCAPYANAPIPCFAETFTFDDPNLQYFFTDALTGCAGLIAVSGDITPDIQVFKPSKALIIHDKRGDFIKLESSKKLLEDFLMLK